MEFTAAMQTVVGAVLTLSILSMLWKENAFYRWGVRLSVGFAMTYAAVTSLRWINIRILTPVSKGDYVWLIPLLLGLMMYFRLSKTYAWVSKYPMSFLFGVGVGVTTVAMLRAQILEQLQFTVTDLFTAKTPMAIISAITVLMAVITVTAYFFFTIEQKGVFGNVTYVGRVFIMGSTAVLWAGDYLWAMSMLAGVLKFLADDFIKGVLLGAA